MFTGFLIIYSGCILDNDDLIKIRLTQFVRNKQHNKLHIFPFTEGHPKINQYVDYFSQDRDGNSKGILYIETGK